MIQHLPGDDGEAGLIPVLPPLAAGQLRTEGRLRDIDCGPDWTVLLLEQEGGTRARFATARLSLPTFIFFGTQPAPVRCGRREAPEHVVITWRADERMPSGSTGIIVSVAFLAGPDGRS